MNGSGSEGHGAPVRLAGVTQALVIVKGLTAGVLGILLVREALRLRAYTGFGRLSEQVLAVRHGTDRIDSWNGWLLLATTVTWLLWQYRLHAYLRRVSPEPPAAAAESVPTVDLLPEMDVRPDQA